MARVLNHQPRAQHPQGGDAPSHAERIIAPAVRRESLLRALAPGMVVSVYLAGFWLYETIAVPRPYWVTPTDIEADMFANALLLASGQPLVGYWLPATPVYLLGGILAKAFNLGLGQADQFLLYGQFLGLLAVIAAVLLASARFLKGVPFVLALAVLFSLFLHPSAQMYLTFFSENTFIFPAVTLAAWALRRSLTRSDGLAPRPVLVAGFAIGAAVSVKLIIAPLVLAGLIGYALAERQRAAAHSPRNGLASPARRWGPVVTGGVPLALLVAALVVTAAVLRQVEVGSLAIAALLGAWGVALVAAAAFLLPWPATGPASAVIQFVRLASVYVTGVVAGWVVATLPAIHLQPSIVAHALDLATRSGGYGSGSLVTTSSVTGNLARNLGVAWQQAPIWVALAVLTILAAVVSAMRSRPAAGPHGGTWAPSSGPYLVTLAAGMVLVAFAVLAARTFGNLGPQPGVSVRYLLPAAALGLFILAHLVSTRPRVIPNWPLRAAVCALVILGVVRQSGVDLQGRRQAIADGVNVKQAVDSALEAGLGGPPGPDRPVLFSATWRPSQFIWKADEAYAEGRLRQQAEAAAPWERRTARPCRSAVPDYGSFPFAAVVDERDCIDAAGWERLQSQGRTEVVEVRRECVQGGEIAAECGLVIFYPAKPAAGASAP